MSFDHSTGSESFSIEKWDKENKSQKFGTPGEQEQETINKIIIMNNIPNPPLDPDRSILTPAAFRSTVKVASSRGTSAFA